MNLKVAIPRRSVVTVPPTADQPGLLCSRRVRRPVPAGPVTVIRTWAPVGTAKAPRLGISWSARTTIRAYSDELASGTGLFAVGTPVQATLHLTNDGIVTDMTKTVTGWFGQSA